MTFHLYSSNSCDISINEVDEYIHLYAFSKSTSKNNTIKYKQNHLNSFLHIDVSW